MVNFKKHLSSQTRTAILDPVKLYDTLDRTHDKGPLRPAQMSVLNDWYNNLRKEKDLIIKLHTGQGKTLVGLLILLSRLNEKDDPVLYLCPDNFLVEQTCYQAKQFGIVTCTTDSVLPDEFLDGKKILVTSVQKLFNGLTKFELFHKSLSVGTILMDDAHACSDKIREACRIRIPSGESAYHDLKTLFTPELEQQGIGTFADLINGKYDALLPVPYWAWIEHENEIAKILSRNSDKKIIKFAWPILKDMIVNCQAVITGGAIEIEPYIPPLEAFGSFVNASHRVFMSATVTDDAFLVKGLGLSSKTILNPLTYKEEQWAGEKMVLIPSLIHEDLNRTEIVNLFAKPTKKAKYGTVALVSSFNSSNDWNAYGAIVTDKFTVKQVINDLYNGKFDEPVVLVNRYDGIDLPDDSCRILIFDSKPYSESLIDLYYESCRPNSEATLMRTLRTIEQGLGRSVRGVKDYSVIIITGTDLTRLVRDRNSRKYLSSQMYTQIDIGLKIAEMANEEIAQGDEPKAALMSLIKQCISRDPNWKAFYQEKMENVKLIGPNAKILKAYEIELKAELAFRDGNSSEATKILQSSLDSGLLDSVEKGWYLQTMARYNYKTNRSESNNFQISAYKNSRLLLRPRSGITTEKLTIVSQNRMERIIDWVAKHDSYEQMNIVLSDILSNLVFGTKADKFEHALNELSFALGFIGERPDKEWKEGPDNLWALDKNTYILWECKSEVNTNRAEINKDETEQMNRSFAWFNKHYNGSNSKNLMIHPTHKVASAASFICDVEITRESELNRLVGRIKAFFKSFESLNFQDLSSIHIQILVNLHKLTIDDLLTEYSKKIFNKTR